MNILNLFRRKPPVDPAALLASATAVHAALLALEGYLEKDVDKRGLALARAVHRALHDAWKAHAGNVGGDVEAFSGGVK